MDQHTKLVATAIHEDAVLLRGFSGLPYIPRRDKEVLCIKYFVDRRHSVRDSKYENLDPNEDTASRDETADGEKEAYKIWPREHFYTDHSDTGARKMMIRETDFPKITTSSRSATVYSIGGPPTPVASPIEEDAQEIRVMDFIGCDVGIAREVIAAITKHPGSPIDPSYLDFNDLDRQINLSNALSREVSNIHMDTVSGFVAGISLRASYGEHQFLRLFVSIPYLGLRRQRSSRPSGDHGQDHSKEVKRRLAGSRTLREYRLQQIGRKVLRPDDKVLVHQTWFIIFDNVKIALFRSEDDSLVKRAPLYPFQPRVGAFQAFANMIANTITSSEEGGLKEFRKGVAKKEAAIYDQIEKEKEQVEQTEPARINQNMGPQPGGQSPSTNQSQHSTVEDRVKDFENDVLDLSTMIKVVRLQIQYLGQLQSIFQNPFGETVGQPRPHKNAFKIPHIHGQREQIAAVLKTLKYVVDERESVFRDLEIWENELKFTRTLLLQATSKQEVEKQVHTQQALNKHMEAAAQQAREAQETLNNRMEAATQQAREIQAAIEKQGQTISLFTLITTIFLPLGFFCAYFAINPTGYEPTITTQREFWARAAPVTGILTLLMTIFVYTPDEKLRDILGRVTLKKVIAKGGI